MKKIICLILMMVLALCCAAALAETQTGEIGGGTWTLDDNGILTFSGPADVSSWRANGTKYQDCLTKVVYGPEVTNIQNDMFSYCYNLTAFEVDPNNPYFCSINGVVYTKDLKELIEAPTAKTGTLTIPEGVKTIRRSAFIGSYLEEVVLPESLTTIEGQAFWNARFKRLHIPAATVAIDATALNLERIEEFTVAEGNLQYSAKDGVLFNKDQTALIHYTPGSTAEAYTIPAGVKTIGSYSFAFVSHLQNLTIPEGVTSIGTDDFMFFYSLNGISLPKSLQKIDVEAFQDMRNLQTVSYAGTQEEWALVTIAGGNKNLLQNDIRCSDGTAEGQKIFAEPISETTQTAALGTQVTLQVEATATLGDVLYEWLSFSSYDHDATHSDTFTVTVDRDTICQCTCSDRYGHSKKIFFFIATGDDTQLELGRQITVTQETPMDRDIFLFTPEGSGNYELFFTSQTLKASLYNTYGTMGNTVTAGPNGQYILKAALNAGESYAFVVQNDQQATDTITLMLKKGHKDRPANWTPSAPESITPGQDVIVTHDPVEGAESYNAGIWDMSARRCIYEIEREKPGDFVFPFVLFADGGNFDLGIGVSDGISSDWCWTDVYYQNVSACQDGEGLMLSTSSTSLEPGSNVNLTISTANAEQVIIEAHEVFADSHQPAGQEGSMLEYWRVLEILDQPDTSFEITMPDYSNEGETTDQIRVAAKKNGSWSAWSNPITTETPEKLATPIIVNKPEFVQIGEAFEVAAQFDPRAKYSELMLYDESGEYVGFSHNDGNVIAFSGWTDECGPGTYRVTIASYGKNNGYTDSNFAEFTLTVIEGNRPAAPEIQIDPEAPRADQLVTFRFDQQYEALRIDLYKNGDRYSGTDEKNSDSITWGLPLSAGNWTVYASVCVDGVWSKTSETPFTVTEYAKLLPFCSWNGYDSATYYLSVQSDSGEYDKLVQDPFVTQYWLNNHSHYKDMLEGEPVFCWSVDGNKDLFEILPHADWNQPCININLKKMPTSAETDVIHLSCEWDGYTWEQDYTVAFTAAPDSIPSGVIQAFEEPLTFVAGTEFCGADMIWFTDHWKSENDFYSVSLTYINKNGRETDWKWVRTDDHQNPSKYYHTLNDYGEYRCVLTLKSSKLIWRHAFTAIVTDENGETPANIMDSGECGENVAYTLYDNGVLHITGSGPMKDYNPQYGTEQPPWRWNSDKITEVRIDSGVTTIGTHAFRYLMCMTDITIPATVTSIGNSAFDHVILLADVHYDGKRDQWVKIAIGKTANEALKNATIHCADGIYDYDPNTNYFGDGLRWTLDNGILTISGTGDMPDFESDNPAPWSNVKNKIRTVIIKNGVTGIGEQAFAECSKLTTVTMADSVTQIRYGAFMRCTALTDPGLSKGLTEIGSAAFMDCPKLKTVTLPGKLEILGTAAFAGSNITSVSVQEGFDTRTWDFFYPSKDGNSYLYHITLPVSVTDAGYGTFSYNPLPHDNPEFILPDGLTAVEANAFAGIGARYVWIPDQVTSIGTEAFADCPSLEYIYIPYGCTIGEDALPENTVILGIGGSPAETYGNPFTGLEDPYSGNG